MCTVKQIYENLNVMFTSILGIQLRERDERELNISRIASPRPKVGLFACLHSRDSTDESREM